MRLLSADYSQVELRILAHLSGEPVLAETFRRGEDVHRATAAEVLGRPADGADAHRARPRQGGQLRDHLRHLRVRAVRAARHPARGGADATSRPTSTATRDVKAFIERTIAEAEERGYAVTLFGRRRPVPELRGAQPPGAVARRAAGGQLDHPGLGGGHHQGRDDREPPPPARGGLRRAAGAADPRRAAVRGAGHRDHGRHASSCARRCAAPTPSTRRWRSTSAWARPGSRPRSSGRPRRAGCGAGRTVRGVRFRRLVRVSDRTNSARTRTLTDI